ncbi:MAG TPA: hypothetical protein PLD10_18695, partial [Rhodopila sp.]|nr:hypothetical protein [Rhodopila sp.]
MSGLTSVTVAQAAAENQLGVPFAIVDTAAAVSSAWDVLATYSNLSSISLTDTGTPTLPVSDTQYTNDAAVLGKLTGSYMLAVTDATAASAAALQADARVASFTVTDTAANIAASFDALNADTKITAIASSTGPVVITDAQYHMDTAAIAMLAQTVEVVVVNNAPVADAATLQADQNVASFTIADTVSAVAAQVSALNADTAVTSIAITDTAANIASALDALNALAPAFTITSTNGPVVITDAQYHTDLTAIAALEQTVEVLVVPDAPVADAAALQADRYVASFSIADTASAVAAQVTALNADTAVTAIAITDTAANIASALDALNALSPAFTITSTNGPVAITGTQYNTDMTAIAALEQTGGTLTVTGAATDAAALQADSNVVSFAVSDTAANIAANFDALNADTKLTSITSSTGPVVISIAQYYSDTAAITKLAQTAEVLVVNNATVADAAALQADQNVASFTIADTASAVAAQVTALNADTALTAIAITDTAANIASALDALNNLALAFTITSTNGPVVITDAQYHTDLTAIAALEQTVQQVLVVSNAPVADAATLQADQYVASFSIADTASAVAAQAAALNADTAVTAIAVTDTAANIATAFDALNTLSPALTISSTSGPVMITDAQYNTDMTAIAALEQTGGMLAVTGATVADVAALQADSNVASFAVTDTAANIAASFDALNADAKLTSITSSTGPVVLSSAQYYSDTSAIAKLAQTVEVLVVNNVTVADAATLQADQNVASFTIADTASA